MATPSAILGILVKADTGQATAALAKTDAQLAATATSAGRTTTAASKSGTALRKLGTAAKWGGAALAVGFVVEAKKAVDTTQELTKSTIGLQKNLGLSAKRASEWGAVARARGVDSTKLGMAFKTLSTQVEAARSGSEASAQSFDALGISQRELAKGSKDVNGLILQVADGIDKLGSGTERTAIQGKLFGRGWATIAPLMRDGSAALKENLDLTDKYGATLTGKTLKAQEALLQNTRESKIAWMGIQVSLAQFVTPALNDVHKQFQRVAAIMASDKLTDDEKFHRVARIIEEDFQKVLDFVLKLIPEIASNVGQAAPQVAAAFVKGFLDADGWGKVVLGGWFISKLGGFGAMSRVGTMMGSRFALGWAAAAAIGIEEGFTGSGGIIDTIHGHSHTTVDEMFPIMKAVDNLKQHYGSLNRAGKVLSSEGKTAFEGLAQAAVDNGSITRAQFDRITAKLEGTGKTYQKVAGVAKNTAERSITAFENEKVKISNTVDSMVDAVMKGYDRLQNNTNKALKGLGARQVDFQLAKNAGKVQHGAVGNQTGGIIVGGSGSGDKVPAMLEPGEVVLNRKAVAALGGANKAHAINSAIPRFASGGVVPAISKLIHTMTSHFPGLSVTSTTGGTHAPGSYHYQGKAVDLASADYGYMNKAAQWVKSSGIYRSLLEGIHNPNLAVQNGKIFSGVGPFGAVWGAHANHIHLAADSLAKAAGIPKALARVMLQGPKGAFRSAGQGGLDKVWGAAKHLIASKQPTGSIETGGLTGVATGPIQAMAKALVSKIWGAGQWGAFNALEMSEAGWNPKALNASSGAAGLAQALPASKYPAGAWPYHGLNSAKLQLQWMMQYIQGRYGTPANAWQFHQAHNWYGKGADFIARRPQMIGVGDGGPERVQVTPLGKGSDEPIINVNIYGDGLDDLISDITVDVMRAGGQNIARSRQLQGRAA